MKYKLLLLDIDGTLRPDSCERVPKENAEAVCTVQKAGVKIAIATGRGRIGPDAEPHGIAELCRALWPEAF